MCLSLLFYYIELLYELLELMKCTTYITIIYNGFEENN